MTRRCYDAFILAAIISWSHTAAALEPGAAVGALRLMVLAGEELEVKNFDQRPATVLVFLSSRCEVTSRVIEVVSELSRKHRYGNVLFVGAFSNSAESADEVRTFAQRSGLVFPVYRDPTGTVARQLGPASRPSFF